MEEKEVIQDLRERLIRIESLLEQETVVSKLKIDSIEKRVEKLESQTTWQNRAIAGGIISGAIALLFK